MNNIEKLFIVLALFNTNLGLSNTRKNDVQKENQRIIDEQIKEINLKIDQLLEEKRRHH